MYLEVRTTEKTQSMMRPPKRLPKYDTTKQILSLLALLQAVAVEVKGPRATALCLADIPVSTAAGSDEVCCCVVVATIGEEEDENRLRVAHSHLHVFGISESGGM